MRSVKTLEERKAEFEIRAVEYLQKLKKPRARFFYRCGTAHGGCYTRKTLKREIWQYKVPPACPCCGDRYNWRLDMYKYKEWQQKIGRFEMCRCDGAWYKHRPGSIQLCIHYKGPIEEPQYYEFSEDT